MGVSPLQVLGVGLFISALGCGGARESPHDAAWETRKGFRMLGVGDDDQVDVTAAKTLYSGFDWVGVRHDLSVNPASKTSVTCTCLRVEHGDPGESRFVWRGPRPDLNPVNQAVAISAIGVDCPGGATNEADRRPSIRGVTRVGNDTVIEVEELPPDRPIATGAIIRPLDPAGHLYIRPRAKNLPYAKTSGRELCRIK
jgi:hypothetical protein